MQQQKKLFKILALGDSLTEGLFNQFTWEMSPYTNKLKQLLEEKYTNYQFEIDNQGVSGEQVTTTMGQRLQEILEKEQNYNLVIILGGTNDLGYGKKPEFIFEQLQNLHTQCWKLKIPTIALTIPQCKSAQETPQRNQINDLLKQMVEKNKEICYLLDFYNYQNYTKMTEEERKLFWANDGLHFSPEGYERMGNLIFEKFQEIKLIE